MTFWLWPNENIFSKQKIIYRFKNRMVAHMKKCLFLLLYRPVSIEIHLYTSPVSFVSKANCLVYSKIGRNKSYPTTYSSKVCQNFWKFSSPTFAAWFLALNNLIFQRYGYIIIKQNICTEVCQHFLAANIIFQCKAPKLFQHSSSCCFHWHIHDHWRH